MSKKAKITIITAIIFFVLATVSAWAGLTKVGYIPNFLNIEILCSEIPEDLHYYPDTSISPDSNSPEIIVPHNGMDIPIYKPVIYLYPQEQKDIRVKLDYKGEIIVDYPNYNKDIKGWDVVAYPDGKIINNFDNREYSYLFWEGMPKDKIDWNLSKGFVVKGENTKDFFQEKLSILGLTPKEYNEFIVYWYPLMQNNEYNFIHFAGDQYTETAPLTITPAPDSVIRVFMVYKPLEEVIQVEEQKLMTPIRTGFTVVEWGGTIVK